MTFSDFTSSCQQLLYFIISAFLTGIIVLFGIKKGIERKTTILIPFSFIILAVFFCYSFQISVVELISFSALILLF